MFNILCDYCWCLALESHLELILLVPGCYGGICCQLWCVPHPATVGWGHGLQHTHQADPQPWPGVLWAPMSWKIKCPGNRREHWSWRRSSLPAVVSTCTIHYIYRTIIKINYAQHIITIFNLEMSTAALILVPAGFVQQKDNVSRTTLIDSVNDVCANCRRKYSSIQ